MRFLKLFFFLPTIVLTTFQKKRKEIEKNELHVTCLCFMRFFKTFFISSNNCLKLPSAPPDPSGKKERKLKK